MKKENIIIDGEYIREILNNPAILVTAAFVFNTVIDYYLADANMIRNYYRRYADDTMVREDNIKKYDGINGDKIQSMLHKEDVFEFLKRMTQEFPNVDYTNLYNNINELKVKDKLVGLKFKDVGGYYDPLNNKLVYNIKVRDSLRRIVIYHELLHVASTYKKDKTFYSGFSQIKDTTTVGIGINEGYTQLLTDKLIKTISLLQPYETESRIAGEIERIVGQDKMQELYFRADLPGLIAELSKYATRNEVIKFINEVDFAHNYKYKKFRKEDVHMIKEVFDDINNFLSRSIERKEYGLKEKTKHK